jgi:exoribonuclease R
MKEKSEIISWKFELKSDRYGFLIPNERAFYGWDFFVASENFGWAKDGDKVKGETLIKSKGKKPEVKIIEIITWNKNEKKIHKVVEGVFSSGKEDFGFIDIEWQEQGYFVYGKKKNGAKDGDRVRAEIYKYNGKDEGRITEILWQNPGEIKTGVYTDNENFGFVKPDDKTSDIFIAGGRKAEAKNKDKVQVRILKTWGRRPEGVIVEVLV